MSLDGLRAWIGEVERKLGKRTRVFLALTVIAIGIAGAGVYLAIDARNSSVSESDVQALQEELEARIDEVAASSTGQPVQPVEPRESGTAKRGDSGNGEGGNSATGGATSPVNPRELLERAQKQK
jgi:hypothetical protein